MNSSRIYFGQWLKDKRAERGLSQGQVALKLNLSKSIVSLWEGGFSAVAIERLFDLAGLYEIDMKELLDKLKEFEPDIHNKFMMLSKKFANYHIGSMGQYALHHRPFALGRNRKSSDNVTYVNHRTLFNKLRSMHIM